MEWGEDYLHVHTQRGTRLCMDVEIVPTSRERSICLIHRLMMSPVKNLQFLLYSLASHLLTWLRVIHLTWRATSSNLSASGELTPR